MQANHGISIDVLNANTPNRVPLNVLLEGGMTLVQIPHGPFKLRIITPHQTDVSVTLDEKDVLKCQVAPGLTELAASNDGRLLTFAPATTGGSVAPPADDQPTLFGAEDGEDTRQAQQPPHVTGFLVVSAKFTEQTPVPGVVPPPYDTQEVAFQMNPPKEHALMVAANFHRIVPPEKIERRWCSCCRRFEDR